MLTIFLLTLFLTNHHIAAIHYTSNENTDARYPINEGIQNWNLESYNKIYFQYYPLVNKKTFNRNQRLWYYKIDTFLQG